MGICGMKLKMQMLEMAIVMMRLTMKSAITMVEIVVHLASALHFVLSVNVWKEKLTRQFLTHWWLMVSAIMKQTMKTATMMEGIAVHLALNVFVIKVRYIFF